METQRIEKRLEALETHIETLENKLAGLENKLAGVPEDHRIVSVRRGYYINAPIEDERCLNPGKYW